MSFKLPAPERRHGRRGGSGHARHHLRALIRAHLLQVVCAVVLAVDFLKKRDPRLRREPHQEPSLDRPPRRPGAGRPPAVLASLGVRDVRGRQQRPRPGGQVEGAVTASRGMFLRGRAGVGGGRDVGSARRPPGRRRRRLTRDRFLLSFPEPLGLFPLASLRVRFEFLAVRDGDVGVVLLARRRRLGDAVLVEEFLLLFVPAAAHHRELRRRPSVHRGGAHERDVHAQAAVHARTVQAQEDAVLDGAPVRVGRGAIGARLRFIHRRRTGFRWRVVERDTGRATTRIRRGEGSSLSSVSRLVSRSWSSRGLAAREPLAREARRTRRRPVRSRRRAFRESGGHDERGRGSTRARRDAGKHDGG